MKKLEELGVSPWPWRARMDFWIDDANGQFVFTDSCVTNLNGENHANGSLIAAAPELYDALQRIVQASDDNAHDFPSWQKNLRKALIDARAAIAKAAGEEVAK